MNLDNLFILLKKKNLSAKDLSESTGISAGNISEWKSGRSVPTTKRIIDVADSLNCSIDYLLGRTDNPHISFLMSSDVVNLKIRMIPLFLTGASAGDGNWLDNYVPAEHETIKSDEETKKPTLWLKSAVIVCYLYIRITTFYIMQTAN